MATRSRGLRQQPARGAAPQRLQPSSTGDTTQPKVGVKRKGNFAEDGSWIEPPLKDISTADVQRTSNKYSEALKPFLAPPSKQLKQAIDERKKRQKNWERWQKDSTTPSETPSIDPQAPSQTTIPNTSPNRTKLLYERVPESSTTTTRSLISSEHGESEDPPSISSPPAEADSASRQPTPRATTPLDPISIAREAGSPQLSSTIGNLYAASGVDKNILPLVEAAAKPDASEEEKRRYAQKIKELKKNLKGRKGRSTTPSSMQASIPSAASTPQSNAGRIMIRFPRLPNKQAPPAAAVAADENQANGALNDASTQSHSGMTNGLMKTRRSSVSSDSSTLSSVDTGVVAAPPDSLHPNGGLSPASNSRKRSSSEAAQDGGLDLDADEFGGRASKRAKLLDSAGKARDDASLKDRYLQMAAAIAAVPVVISDLRTTSPTANDPDRPAEVSQSVFPAQVGAKGSDVKDQLNKTRGGGAKKGGKRKLADFIQDYDSEDERIAAYKKKHLPDFSDVIVHTETVRPILERPPGLVSPPAAPSATRVRPRTAKPLPPPPKGPRMKRSPQKKLASVPTAPRATLAGSEQTVTAKPSAESEVSETNVSALPPTRSSDKSAAAPASMLTPPKDTSDSDDFCANCKTGGYLVCCDGCDRAFHTDCLDPPVGDACFLGDPWYCRLCIAEKEGVPVPPAGEHFGGLAVMIGSANEKNYALPSQIREYFHGVKEYQDGSYGYAVETVPNKNTKRAFMSGRIEDHDEYRRLVDDAGNPILCYYCKLSAKSSTSMHPDHNEFRDMIPCDYCEHHWHIDCIDPPLAKPPGINVIGKRRPKWQCPLHAIEAGSLGKFYGEHGESIKTLMPSDVGRPIRVPKNKGRNDEPHARVPGPTKNNSLIEVVDDDEKEEYYDPALVNNGAVNRLNEGTIILDFITRAKRDKAQTDEWRRRDRDIHLREAARLEHANQARIAGEIQQRAINERRAALSLLDLAGMGNQGYTIENLVNTLMDEAPKAVVDLMEPNDEPAGVSRREKSMLERIRDAINKRLGGS